MANIFKIKVEKFVICSGIPLCIITNWCQCNPPNRSLDKNGVVRGKNGGNKVFADFITLQDNRIL